MRIGFDLDEVVIDHTNPLVELTNKQFGLELSQESFKVYNFKKNIYSTDHAKNKEITEFLIYYANDDEFQFKLKPYAESVNTINFLKKLNHTIYFITSRPVENTDFTEEWLRQYGIPYDKLIVLGYGKEKGPVGKSSRLDFYLDDTVHHLDSMFKYKRNWSIGLFVIDRPWNKYSDEYNRVYNWSEVKDIFRIGGQYV